MVVHAGTSEGLIYSEPMRILLLLLCTYMIKYRQTIQHIHPQGILLLLHFRSMDFISKKYSRDLLENDAQIMCHSTFFPPRHYTLMVSSLHYNTKDMVRYSF